MIEGYGYSATAAGLTLVPATVTIGILSRFVGQYVDRIGTRWPLVVGSAIVALGLSYLGWMRADGLWTVIVPSLVTLGIGMGLVVSPLSTAVMNAAASGKEGVASGINNAISRTANLLAVAGLGLVAALAFTSTGAAGTFGEGGGANYEQGVIAGLVAVCFASAALCAAASVTALLAIRDE